MMSKDLFHISKQYFGLVCKLLLGTVLCLEDFLTDIEFLTKLLFR